jgi:hypothetical protein
LADREEQVVVPLRKPPDVRKFGRKQGPQLRQDRAAQGEQAFLLALAVNAKDAPLAVEVANLNARELRTPESERE